jgi:hypothetical protein
MRHAPFRLLAIVLLAGWGVTDAYADSIKILSQMYYAEVTEWTDFTTVSEFSTTEGVDVSLSGIDCDGCEGYASASGTVGRKSGSLFADTGVASNADAYAFASIDFTSASQIALSLSASGFVCSSGSSWIELINVTDNIRLLELYAPDDCQTDLSGFFTFPIEASKSYRLSAKAATPPDIAWASVNYTVAAVPEPSVLATVVSCLAALGIARKKRTLK